MILELWHKKEEYFKRIPDVARVVQLPDEIRTYASYKDFMQGIATTYPTHKYMIFAVYEDNMI